MKNICIVRLSALGDVLMLLPLARALQDHIPDCRISWVISRPAYDLVAGIKDIEFILIDKPRSLSDYLQFKKQMAGRQFDVLLAPQASLRANLLYPLIKAKRKIGYDSARARDLHRLFIKEQIAPGKEHTLEGFLKFAEPLGIKNPAVRWDIPLSEDDYQWGRQYIDPDRKTLLVNPVASKAERSWLLERYIDVIGTLQADHNVQVILTGGPGQADKEFSEAITARLNVLNLAGKTRPPQLMALIDMADAMLCPDTGPSHMAAAMKTPVVAMHAVTNPDISGPYGYRHHVVNAYPDALKKCLNTTPEKAPWGTQVHKPDAMALVETDKVTAELVKALDLVPRFPVPGSKGVKPRAVPSKLI